MSWPTFHELKAEVERRAIALTNAQQTLGYYGELDEMLRIAKRMNRTLFRINDKWVMSDCMTVTARALQKPNA